MENLPKLTAQSTSYWLVFKLTSVGSHGMLLLRHGMEHLNWLFWHSPTQPTMSPSTDSSLRQVPVIGAQDLTAIGMESI